MQFTTYLYTHEWWRIKLFQRGMSCDWKCHCDISKPLTHPMYWKIQCVVCTQPNQTQPKSIDLIKNLASAMPAVYDSIGCEAHMCRTFVRDKSNQFSCVKSNRIWFHIVSLKMVSITAQWWDLIKIIVCCANQIFHWIESNVSLTQ